MMKKNEVVALGLAFIILTMSLPAMARSYSSSKNNNSAAYGPEGKRFGAGLYLGEPTGITLKGYLTEKLAIDGIAAWSFKDKGFTIIGDVTYDFLDIPIDSNVVTLPFYAGAGAKLEFNAGPNDKTVAGIRVPVGVAVQWVEYPVEVFAEIAPGIEVAPSTEFDLMGGIGVRYYF